MRRVLQTQGESGTAGRAMAPILAIATPAGKPVPCTYMNPGGGRVDVLVDNAVSAGVWHIESRSDITFVTFFEGTNQTNDANEFLSIWGEGAASSR